MLSPRLLNLFRLLLVAVAALPSIGSAQTYPVKPISMILPFPPSGGTDVAARTFAQQLSERLGQGVIVDSRPGAGGTLGTGIFARAAADGYTLLFTAQSPITTADLIVPSLSYSPARDLVPVALTHWTPLLVVVPPNLNVANLGEFAAATRAAPGTFFFGSPGSGNELHLVAEWIKRELKMDITHVPYKGSGPALIDLMAGRTQMLVASPASVSQHIAQGRLKAIATLSNQRLPGFPNVPTAAESGYPQLHYDAWFGLFARAGTPIAILARLQKEAEALASAPAYRKQVSDLGMIPVALGSNEFAQVIQRNRALWSTLVPSLNLTEEIFK
jgi:tripartite-type tricarboxylate transporter receptor subunit TctC